MSIDSLYDSGARLIDIAGTMLILWAMAKIYCAVVEAHKPHIYNEINYTDCTIEKDEEHE